MSQENVEVVRKAFHAAADQGPNAALELFHPEAEWYPQKEDPDPSPRRGREAIRKMFDGWFEAWEDFRIEAEEMIDAGEKVLVYSRIAGKGRGSGVPFPSLDAAHVVTVRDGQIARVEAFYDRDDALKAAGVAE